MTTQTSGIAASQRLGIKDEVLGLDIDNAVSLRLLQFETERDKQRAKLIAYEVSKLFSEDNDVLDDDSIAEYIRNDPSVDKNTMLW